MKSLALRRAFFCKKKADILSAKTFTLALVIQVRENSVTGEQHEGWCCPPRCVGALLAITLDRDNR